MTQEQLAAKCGTTKTYISRIENNAFRYTAYNIDENCSTRVWKTFKNECRDLKAHSANKGYGAKAAYV